MKPADVLKISMDTSQADEVLFGNVKMRSVALDFASKILMNKPTPAQAQATLVLAWNEVLARSELISREER